MREAIRQQLINAVPDISGRVYEPHAASAKTAKPYLVLLQGPEDEESAWVNFQRTVEIWPCVARTTFKELDILAAKVAAALDKVKLETQGLEAFTLIYQGVQGDDTVVEEWDALTRCLRFSILALQPAQIAETVPDDPWLTALATWTAGVLGQDWTVYLNRWPQGYVRPSVLWRLSGYRTENVTKTIYKVSRQVNGHILGRTPNEEAAAALLLMEKLEASIKIPLNIQEKKYMTRQNPLCDLKAHAILKGQLTFNLFRFTSSPAVEVPLMMHVYSQGTMN